MDWRDLSLASAQPAVETGENERIEFKIHKQQCVSWVFLNVTDDNSCIVEHRHYSASSG
jgi:hypothetical protein